MIAIERVKELRQLLRTARENPHAIGNAGHLESTLRPAQHLLRGIAGHDAGAKRGKEHRVEASAAAKVEHTLARAKTTTEEGISAVRGKAGEVSEVTDEYVRENPWAAIGIAAAIGIVIGFVAGRR